MHYLFSERRTFVTITWLLTGLLLMGGLYNSLPALKGALVCAEERVLETELENDDKNEARELDFAFHIQIGDRAPAEVWRNVRVCFSFQPHQTRLGSHLVRGPPRC